MVHAGFTDVIRGLVYLGLFSPEPHPYLHEKGPALSWRELLCHLLSLAPDTFYDNLLETLTERVGSESRMRAIVSLGLCSDTAVPKGGTPLDTLSQHLANVLALDHDERDMLLLRHEIEIKWPDRRREERGINLVSYGTPGGYSAMAKCVGYPCAIATKMLLDKEIQKKGLVFPFTPDIYKPLLMRLADEGIVAKEKSRFL